MIKKMITMQNENINETEIACWGRIKEQKYEEEDRELTKREQEILYSFHEGAFCQNKKDVKIISFPHFDLDLHRTGNTEIWALYKGQSESKLIDEILVFRHTDIKITKSKKVLLNLTSNQIEEFEQARLKYIQYIKKVKKYCKEN